MTDDPEPGPKAMPDRLRPGRSMLGRLVSAAERLERIQRIVDPLLPPGLRGHVSVSSLDTGHLRLLVTSSARATQLRYQQRQILARLDELTGEPVQHLSIAVRPRDVEPRARTSVAARPVPTAAAAQLRDLAANETDPELRKALERLARRTS